MPARGILSRVPRAIASGLAFALLCALLVAAGQPLFTDDLWWHLALGEAYALQGPWLDADPLLFTAELAPAPASWLADWALAQLASTGGLNALRVLHVGLVAGLLALVWQALRRASGSPLAAWCATAVFAALSAYRLAQLRPHLLTIAAALLLFHFVLARREAPTAARLGVAVLGLALWANLHGGFLLGPAMLLGCAAACGGASLAAGDAPAVGALRRRAGLLAATGLAGFAATGLNPSGFSRHAALFTAGQASPSLRIVLDEWSHWNPFAWPVTDLPPSPLSWVLLWALLLAVPWACVRWLRRDGLRDPGVVCAAALALASLAASIYAVRFVWMSAFALCFVAGVLFAGRETPGSRARGPGAWIAAGAMAALLLGFGAVGSWPMLTRGLSLSSLVATFRAPYAPGKYHGHAVWFLRDAGLRGRLFNEYVSGGFLGYWLAPELRGFVNGTLNMQPGAMDALEAIRQGEGELPGESLEETLDRYGVDVFLGVGDPALPQGSRPRFYTTALLEASSNWVSVFRNQRSAVYLRRSGRNSANFERARAYYAERGLPFEPERGFAADEAIEAGLAWARENGVVPAGMRKLQQVARGGRGERQAGVRDRLAQLYAVLGLYEHALRIDRRLLRERPALASARRRVVWSLLRTGRYAEARAESVHLSEGPLELLLRSAADALERDPEDPVARALLGRLPLLTAAEVYRARLDTMPPAVRDALSRGRAPAG